MLRRGPAPKPVKGGLAGDFEAAVERMKKVPFSTLQEPKRTPTSSGRLNGRGRGAVALASWRPVLMRRRRRGAESWPRHNRTRHLTVGAARLAKPVQQVENLNLLHFGIWRSAAATAA